MKNMIIGIDASPAFRAHKTGVEWYCYHLMNHLLKQTEDEYVLYTDLPAPGCKLLSWPWRYFWSEARLSWEMMRYSPDVLFIPGRGTPLVHPKRTVSVIHDVGFLADKRYRGRLGIAYLIYATHFALRASSRCITMSEYTKQELISRFHADPSRLEVVPLGVDNAVYHTAIPPEEILHIKRAHHLSSPYIITIGRIDHRKNILTLLEAFAKIKKEFPSLLLVIVGPKGFGSEKSMQKIHTHSFANDIRYVGWVEEKEKAALLAGADAFVFPSAHEGFGLPILEAQAVGTPVLAARNSSLPEVAGEGALFFDTFSSEECAQQVCSVLTSSAATQNLIEKGFENDQKYSWEETARKTWEVLHTI